MAPLMAGPPSLGFLSHHLPPVHFIPRYFQACSLLPGSQSLLMEAVSQVVRVPSASQGPCPAPRPQPGLPMECQHRSSKGKSEYLPTDLSSPWPKRDHDVLCSHTADLHWGRQPGLGCKTQFPGQTIWCHTSLLSHHSSFLAMPSSHPSLTRTGHFLLCSKPAP